MNTVILYTSKYGCTADCAAYLKAGLPGEVSVVDIGLVDAGSVDLEGFDTVILGSSVYVGAISRSMKDFCRENEELLCGKRVGIFLCLGFADGLKECLSKNFSSKLLEKAAVIKQFGGEARMERMKGMDKLIMKAVTKGGYSDLKISYDEMASFLKEIAAG